MLKSGVKTALGLNLTLDSNADAGQTDISLTKNTSFLPNLAKSRMNQERTGGGEKKLNE